MNPAQKRIWWTFAISLLTLIVSGVVIMIVKQGHIDLDNHNIYRITGGASTIPLILFAVLDKLCPKKDLDERELYIEKKATFTGIVGTFVLMALVAIFLTIQDFKGTISIPRMYLCSFIYILLFVFNLFSSSAAIVYYYMLTPFKIKNLQGESK